MSSIVILRAFQRIERFFGYILGGSRYPPGELCIVQSCDVTLPSSKKNSSFDFNLEKLMKESFLFAVPKHRRTVEKKMCRKFGNPKYHWKLIVPRTNLLTCMSCGSSFEAGHLCTTCYQKVQTETKLMQDAVQAELGLTPVEKEVVVLYKGEKEEYPSEFWQGKRIVELEKERPSWYSKNLLEKTTQQPSTSKDVKPTELA